MRKLSIVLLIWTATEILSLSIAAPFTVYEQDFSGLFEGNLDGQDNWEESAHFDAHTNDTYAFYVTANDTIDTMPYEHLWTPMDGAYIIRYAALTNNVDDEFTYTIDFRLKTTAYPDWWATNVTAGGITNIANAAKMDHLFQVYNIGLTSGTNWLQQVSHEDCVVVVRTTTGGVVEAGFDTHNEGVLGHAICSLLDSEVNWDPRFRDTNAAAPDFETDMLRLQFTMRKTRTYGIYRGINASLSNLNTGAVSDPTDPGTQTWKPNTNLYNTGIGSVHLAMGHNEYASRRDEPYSLIHVEIDKMVLEHESGVAPTTKYPPSDVQAEAADHSAILTWGEALDATDYTVYRASFTEGPYVAVASNITALTYLDDDPSLNNGYTYFYKVAAVYPEFPAGQQEELSDWVPVRPLFVETRAQWGVSDTVVNGNLTGDFRTNLQTYCTNYAGVIGSIEHREGQSVSPFGAAWYHDMSTNTQPDYYTNAIAPPIYATIQWFWAGGSSFPNACRYRVQNDSPGDLIDIRQGSAGNDGQQSQFVYIITDESITDLTTGHGGSLEYDFTIMEHGAVRAFVINAGQFYISDEYTDSTGSFHVDITSAETQWAWLTNGLPQISDKTMASVSNLTFSYDAKSEFNDIVAVGYYFNGVGNQSGCDCRMIKLIVGDSVSPYQLWMDGYGIYNEDADPYYDYDGDGIINWDEWILGSDPTNAASPGDVPQHVLPVDIESFSIEEGPDEKLYPVIAFTRAQEPTDIDYTVLVNDDLVFGPWIDIPPAELEELSLTNLPYGESMVEMRYLQHVCTTTSRFFRVEATIPFAQQTFSEMTGLMNIDADIDVVASMLVHNPHTLMSTLTLNITNTSGTAYLGPFYLIVEGISDPSVSLANADGAIGGLSYFEIAVTNLPPGETTEAILVFDNPYQGSFAITNSIHVPEPEPPCESCCYCDIEAGDGGNSAFLYSGEKKLNITDLTTPGLGNLDWTFRRTYRSRASRYRQNSCNDFGLDWRVSYIDDRLVQDGNNVILCRVVPFRDFLFLSKGVPGSWESPIGFHEVLSTNVYGEFELRTTGGTVRTFENFGHPDIPGRLIRIEDRNGNIMDFAYEEIDPDGMPANGDEKYVLVSVLDTVGREIRYRYHAATLQSAGGEDLTIVSASASKQGRLAEVKDFTGRILFYDYDADSHLVRATGPGVTGTPTGNDFPLGMTYRYRYLTASDLPGGLSSYQQDRLLHNLTHIWYPNEVGDNPDVDPADGLAHERIDYGMDPDNPQNFGRVVGYTFGGTNGSGVPAGGTKNYNYSLHPSASGNDPSLPYLRVGITDRRGNYEMNSYSAWGTVIEKRGGTSSYDPHTVRRTSKVDALGRITDFMVDSVGNRTNVIDALWNETHYEYETNFNKLVRSTDPNGVVTEYGYDASGNRISETVEVGGLGFTREWTYDAAGNVVTEKDFNGNVATNEYDAAGNLVKTKDPLGGETSYTYDDLGRRISVTDANGHTISNVYNTLGWRIKTIDPLGYESIVRYDREGHPVQTTDRNSNSVFHVYDMLGQIVATTNALGGIRRTTYDANGNRTADIDENGHTTTYQYDAWDRMTNTVDAYGYSSATVYNPVHNVTARINRNGYATTYGYDDLNRLLVETNALGNITAYEYDAGPGGGGCGCGAGTQGASHIIKQTDANGHVTYYKYCALGRRIETIRKQGDTADTIDSDDAVISYGYDPNGNTLSVTDPVSNITVYAYDALNRQTAITNGAGEATLTTYDPVGNILVVAAPNGNVTTNTYDELDRLVQVDDSIGRIVNYSYDPVGNRLSTTADNTNTVHYLYDALNRPVVTTDAMGESSTNLYDSVGNLIRYTDREGNVTEYAYDACNRRTNTVDPIGSVTAYSYDGVGNLTILTDANLNSTLFEYDALNRLIEKTYPDPEPNTLTYTYDGVGNLTSRTDQMSNTTYYSYSDLNLLTLQDYPNDADDRFTYDLAGRMLSASKTNWLTSADWAVTYAYDAANRVTNSTQGGQAIAYAYNIPSRTRTLTYPSGTNITETMDLRGRLSTINDGGATPIATYAYDPGSRIDTRTYRNGVVAGYTYNANSWITKLEHKLGPSTIVGFQHDYFDKEGNKLTELKLHDTGNSEAYQYDAIYQLTNYHRGTLVGSTIPAPSSQTAWDFNPMGNWDSLHTNGVLAETRSHDNANELTQINAENLSYDANGNLTDDGANTYTWDEENRLIQVTRKSDSKVLAQYAYDHLSRRITKVVDPTGTDTETRFYYDGFNAIKEHTSGESPKEYIWGTDLSGTRQGAGGVGGLVAVIQSGNTYYAAYDTRGNVVAYLDSSGTAVASFDYLPFGALAGSTGIASDFSYRFSTKPYDPETGHYYYNYRYYSPELGRWLSRDPIGERGGLNLYRFVRNAPVQIVDPVGKNPAALWWGIRIGGALLGLANSWEAADMSADKEWDYVVGNTRLGPRTLWHQPPKGESEAVKKCPEGKDTKTIFKHQWKRKWFNAKRGLQIDMTCGWGSGEVSGHLTQIPTGTGNPAAGYMISSIEVSTRYVDHECECFKKLPCVFGDIVIRSIADQPGPWNSYRTWKVSFECCATGAMDSKIKNVE